MVTAESFLSYLTPGDEGNEEEEITGGKFTPCYSSYSTLCKNCISIFLKYNVKIEMHKSG